MIVNIANTIPNTEIIFKVWVSQRQFFIHSPIKYKVIKLAIMMTVKNTATSVPIVILRS